MIVFALRHADKANEDLSRAGIVRAELLAHMLAESGVGTAFCSDAARTRRTIDPLKKLLGSNLNVVPVSTKEADGGIDGHVQRTVEGLKALPANAVAVVVGHTNTVGRIVKGVSGQTVAAIEENEFDRMFVVFIPATGTATVTPMRYGNPTP